MPLIDIRDLTKDYGNRRGIFDLNLAIQPGETFGLVGANGAGKTTTIRHLMGFLKPNAGKATIGGLDCWQDAAAIKQRVGYVPGEIAFPDASTGLAFLHRQAELLRLKDMSLAHSLIARLQLDPTANLKRMSKGMKQKTAIVAAFMADPDILILDEPTTGLDPLMRAAFLDLLAEQKQQGKTIFMSTHMLEEVEQVCDRVAFIKDGRVVAVKDIRAFKHNEHKVYQLDFQSHESFDRFVSSLSSAPFATVSQEADHNRITVRVHDRDINRLLTILTAYNLKSFSEVKRSLEEEIIHLIRGGNAHDQQDDF